MPPRAELDRDYADGALAVAAVAIAAKPSSPAPKSSLRERRRPRIPFNSTHGVSGLTSTLLTCAAIAVQRAMSSNAMIASIASVLAAVASIVTAASGMTIVDQAPKQTVVMKHPIKVIPPHRDAFLRTAFSIYYLCGRIGWNAAIAHLMNNSATRNDNIGWVWGCTALFYAIIYFVPKAKDIDWTNGNTYVFVLPMAIGLTADALFQLPILQCHGATCWNSDVITNADLLWVLLSGLVVAFVFTLAFRGVLGIKNCYWGAAVVVHGIVAYLIVKALPFAMLQFLS